MFSRHSVYLSNHDAKTLDQLKLALVASWESRQNMGRVKIMDVDMAADAKAWLQDHVDDRLHHHTTAHQYVFEMKVHSGEQRCVLTVKNYSVSKPEDWKVVGPLLKVCGILTMYTNALNTKVTLGQLQLNEF